MKLYVKDTYTGTVHQVGTNRHDSLIIHNGGLFYYNLQNGEGTMFGGYEFCTENGNTDFGDEMYDTYYHIGFSEEKFKEQHEKDLQKLKEIVFKDE